LDDKSQIPESLGPPQWLGIGKQLSPTSRRTPT
jgi:hypothetical protein